MTVFPVAGAVANVTIPSNLAPGNYMIRHEIIALHLAPTMGGAEFYEGCAQLKVGGSQTGQPKASDLVSLPGAYKDDDPGIFVNIFNSNFKTYSFPGPPIATFITGNTTTSGATGTPKKPGHCKVRKGKRTLHSPTSTPTFGSFNPPPHIMSHIMRRHFSH